jgi:hypothetical protein
MPYKILADITVFIHLLWILFLISGAVWGRRNKAVKIFHFSGLVFALTLQIFHWYCPLTHLEVWLRERHNPDLTYTGSFIIHYMEEIVYIRVSGTVLLSLTIFICVLNTWLYLKKVKS